MSKLKHVAIVISALSVMGVASVSLASTSCSTTISQSTATCLSNAADSTFQSDYATEYANQKSGVGNQDAFARQPNNSAAAPRSSVLPQVQQKQSTADTTNNNDNNNSTKQSVHWF